MLTVHNFHFIIYKYVYPELKNRQKYALNFTYEISYHLGYEYALKFIDVHSDPNVKLQPAECEHDLSKPRCNKYAGSSWVFFI